MPCDTLVFSATRDAGPGLGRIAILARELGIERVILHGAGPPDLVAAVDQVAVGVERPDDVPVTPPHSSWVAHVPLTRAAIGSLRAIGDHLIGARPTRVVLSWPYPGLDVDVPPVHEALAAARDERARLTAAGLPTVVRGLPPCVDLPDPAATRPGRTRNRFYVDADHRGESARLFVPEVVQFLKPDACRSCSWNAECDGVARVWLDAGVMGRLEPLPAVARPVAP